MDERNVMQTLFHSSIRFVDGWMKNYATLGLSMDEWKITQALGSSIDELA